MKRNNFPSQISSAFNLYFLEFFKLTTGTNYQKPKTKLKFLPSSRTRFEIDLYV